MGYWTNHTEPLYEVTLSISCCTVDLTTTKGGKTTTKRHKIGKARCETTQKRRQMTKRRCRTTTETQTSSGLLQRGAFCLCPEAHSLISCPWLIHHQEKLWLQSDLTSTKYSPFCCVLSGLPWLSKWELIKKTLSSLLFTVYGLGVNCWFSV